jgi:hypothetical protein
MKTDWTIRRCGVVAIIVALGGTSTSALTVDSSRENGQRNQDEAINAYTRIHTHLLMDGKQETAYAEIIPDPDRVFPILLPTGNVLRTSSPGAPVHPLDVDGTDEEDFLLDKSILESGNPVAALRSVAAPLIPWPEKHSAMLQPDDPQSGPAEAEDWLFTLQYADFPQNAPRSPIIPVPEPTTCTLFLLGTGLLARRRFHA